MLRFDTGLIICYKVFSTSYR